jgi:integrase
VQGVLDRDVLPVWKGRDARTIKPREVIELLDGIVRRGSRVMANHTARILGQLFKYGIHRAIVDDSPVKLLVLPGGKEKPRDRALSDAELKVFLSDPLKCTRQPRLAYVVELLLLTAARRGELCAAKWTHVDLQAKTWFVPAENSKTDKPYTIPLSGRAQALFERLKKRGVRSVWVLPGIDPSKHLEPRLLTRATARCMKRFNAAGIKDFTLHDLRRTCRTGLGRLKVAPHIAEMCLNHAQGGIVGTYDTHSYMPEMRAALEKWAGHMKGLCP